MQLIIVYTIQNLQSGFVYTIVNRHHMYNVSADDVSSDIRCAVRHHLNKPQRRLSWPPAGPSQFVCVARELEEGYFFWRCDKSYYCQGVCRQASPKLDKPKKGDAGHHLKLTDYA